MNYLDGRLPFNTPDKVMGYKSPKPSKYENPPDSQYDTSYLTYRKGRI